MSAIRKPLSILICLFIIQMSGSCLYRCNDPKTYSVSFDGVDILTFDTSGFTTVDADSALYKNSFAIGINFQTQEEEISDYRIASSIGFNAATALSCEDDFFVYEDDISDIQIIRIENDGNETNMTNAFSRTDYNDREINLTEMVEDRSADNSPSPYRNDYFSVELSDYQDLPKVFKLRVEVSLESGTLLKSETGTLYFVD